MHIEVFANLSEGAGAWFCGVILKENSIDVSPILAKMGKDNE